MKSYILAQLARLGKWLVKITSATIDPHQHLYYLLREARLISRQITEHKEAIAELFEYGSSALENTRREAEQTLMEAREKDFTHVCIEINRVMHKDGECRTRDGDVDRYLMHHKRYSPEFIETAYTAWCHHQLDDLPRERHTSRPQTA